MRLLPPLPARLGRSRAVRAALFAVVCLLAVAQNAAANGDPVDDLNQALREPPPGTDDKAGRDARKANLQKQADKLTSLVDLSRAIVLPDWRYNDRDTELARVDLDVFKSVANRFQADLKKRVESKDPIQQAAAGILVGEMANAVPSTRGATGQEARKLLVKVILRDLAPLARSGNVITRAATARAIGRILANTRDVRDAPDTKVAFDALREVFRSDDARARRSVVYALSDFLRVFSEQQTDPRETASLEQGDLDVIADEILPLAFQASRETDPALRRLSIDIVQRFAELLARRLRPVDPSARRVPGPPEGIDRVRPLRGVRAKLERFEAAVPDIRRLLKDPDLVVRERTLRLLEDLAAIRSNVRGGLPPDVIDEKPKPGENPRWLVKLFGEVMDDLLHNLTNSAPQLRLIAVETLENLGPEAYAQAPAVVERLTDSDPIVRWAATRALGRINGKAVPGEIDALARTLRDRDLSVRMEAAVTLEVFAEQAASAVPELVRQVNVGDADVRIGVLRALAAIRKDGPQVVPVAARALSHPDRRVRRAAAETIGRFGADARLALDALAQAARDGDAEVRRFASEALLNIPPR